MGRDKKCHKALLPIFCSPTIYMDIVWEKAVNTGNRCLPMCGVMTRNGGNYSNLAETRLDAGVVLIDQLSPRGNVARSYFLRKAIQKWIECISMSFVNFSSNFLRPPLAKDKRSVYQIWPMSWPVLTSVIMVLSNILKVLLFDHLFLDGIFSFPLCKMKTLASL